MKPEKIERLSVEAGYNLWAESYDATPNPVVALDRRQTIPLLAPQDAELILDAGCGTGRNLAALLDAKSQPVGIDFSAGMLDVARQKFPSVELHQTDLQKKLPFEDEKFDAVLCALIGEHLGDLKVVFREFFRVLKPSGRLVFSTYHPAMAAAGKEANFQKAGIEYRLGAFRHTTQDYQSGLEQAGFAKIEGYEFVGDEELVKEVPAAARLLDFPVLLVLKAKKIEE